MRTETKEQFEERIRAGQAKYDAFRYTDAQRRQVLQIVEIANQVIRGEVKLSTLANFSPVRRTMPDRRNGPEGTRYSFDAPFLNEWTSMFVVGIGSRKELGEVEPYYFQITFEPEMTGIPREYLEQLLKLRAMHGWTSEGGNLRGPGFPLHVNFYYSPLEQPSKDFMVEVRFLYLGALSTDLQGLYAANELSQIEIRRRYLTPEEIHERDHKRFGHMPRTGERCTVHGVYIPHFADDEITRIARQMKKQLALPVGSVFGPAYFWNSRLGRHTPVPAWWEWVGPDPLAHLMTSS